MHQLAGQLDIEVDGAMKVLLGYPLSTLRYYDFGPASPPNQVTPTDLGRFLLIEPLNQRVAVPILEASHDAPWDAVDVDARLIDAHPESVLYDTANKLYEHFTFINDVGHAITSKLLHLKRPGFFPLLDSEVRKLYDQAAQAAYRRSTSWMSRHPEWRHLYWAAIREDLFNPQNRLSAVSSMP